MSDIITPEAILSFPNLFTPRAPFENQEPKYSCSLVFTREAVAEDVERFNAMKKAVIDLANETWGKDALKNGKLHPSIRSPFLSGADKAQYGYPEDSIYITIRSTRKPGVLLPIRDPNTGKLIPVEDEEEIYPGAIVRGALGIFAYKQPKKGISFALNGILKIRDGERLDSFVAAEDVFDADEFAQSEQEVVDAFEAENTSEDAVETADAEDPLADLVSG